MTVSSERFPEQYSRVQQQFKDWSSFEQLYAVVELTRSFQLSYRHFLLQLFQANIKFENNDMFNHTVDDANAPDIVSCLLSSPLDKILFTIQLYLPLISTKTINEKLIEAYRDILVYLDSHILNSSKFTYNEQQILTLSKQILFFIEKNPYLHILSLHIPQLIKLVQTSQFQSDEQQSFNKPLRHFSSIRAYPTEPSSLMNYVSEGLPHPTTLCQQLTRHETTDSGVDLRENSITNQLQNFLSSPNQQNSFIDQSYRSNLSSANKHSFVAKTASSPIPEYVALNPSQHTPLKSVLSAPPSTLHSDYRNKNYSMKHVPVLSKSDEEEPELQKSNNEHISDTNNSVYKSKLLSQFCSLRYPNTKRNQDQNNVSPYLAIDTSSSSIRNTFTQANTGMRDVPKWLRHLRLHKYDAIFSKMSYDQMMNLTIDDLKELHIVDGACSKIVLNIKKLKERSTSLKQWLIEMDEGLFDLQGFVGKLNELLITPIRSKQLELENNNNEDLPSLIMQVLEKIFKQISPSTPPEISNSVLGLFDRCYKHEAFTDDQRNILLHWRGRLSHMLQSLGKIEYKIIQSASSHPSQQRRTGKSLKHFRSTVSGPFYSNLSTNSVGLSRFKSEPQNNYNEANLIRRPNKSPTHIQQTNEESNENYLQATFSCLTSTPQNTNNSYSMNNQHQHQALTRKLSINPSDESNSNNNNNRTKLCKTFSDPSKIRFYNPQQINQMQLSACQHVQQQSLFRMISTPYSQPYRNFISQSPPTTTLADIPSSPIKKCFSEHERLDYYDNQNESISLSTASNTTDIENGDAGGDDQRHHNTKTESLCRQTVESAMSDDVKETSLNLQDKNSDVKQSSNNSTDTEQ